MSAFTTPLDLEYLDGRNWLLTKEFDFASDTLERIIRVPVGFTTDFASIPRILWVFLPPTGKYGKAAVVHDDLYRFPQMIHPAVSRRLADLALWEGMTALGVNWLTKWIMWLGVRVGGRSSYRD